jgi:uncharacterized membrane protein YbhN (UPF0104 family)
MWERLRPWVPLFKLVLFIAILVGVGLLFARILQSEELQSADRSRTPGQILWDQTRQADVVLLTLAGVLYLAGLFCFCAFWVRLLAQMNQPLPVLTAARIFYISHLGKYAPLGKGWALLMRVTLSANSGVRVGTAAVSGAYETLTMMAGGALIASVVMLVQAQQDRGMLLRALLLLAVVVPPIIPRVFNFIVRKLAGRFQSDPTWWPRLGFSTLLGGLLLVAVGWTVMGGSLALTMKALLPSVVTIDLNLWMRCTSYVAVSWVAGFIATTPGGLGVRELLLQQMLAGQLGPMAVVVVVVLRLLWTAAELVAAGLIYWVPPTRIQEEQ